MVLEIAGILIAVWLGWKLLSPALRLVGWGLVAVGVFHADAATADLGGTIVTIGAGVVAVTAGHPVFYIRRGFWKPRLLRSRAAQALSTAAMQHT